MQKISAIESSSSSETARNWKDLLLNPTIIAALLGFSGPIVLQVFTALLQNVPLDQYLNPRSRAQYEQVMANADCLAPSKFSNFNASPKEFSVSSVACPSKNLVALYIKGPAFPNGTYQFVEVKSSQAKPLANFLIPEAVAASLSGLSANQLEKAKLEQATRLICQKQLDGGRLLRRIQDGDGCIDEIIDMFSGNVISRQKSSSCNGNC